jgi:hypothetical protein
MDLKLARVALRERSILEVLDLAVAFVSRHRAAYLRTMLVACVPPYVVACMFGAFAGWEWAWVTAVLLGAAAQAPFTILASRLVFEGEVRARDAVSAALRAMPKVVVVRLAQLLGTVASLAALVVPGVLAAGAMLFVSEAFLLERADVGAVFGRSRRLASTRFDVAVGGVFALTVVVAGAVLLGDVAGRSVVSDVLEFRAPPSMFEAGGGWLPMLGFWIVVPFVATARFLLYLDFRTRSEGWDVQTRFAAIAARDEEPDEPAKAA